MRRAVKKDPGPPPLPKFWGVSVLTDDYEWEIWTNRDSDAQTVSLNHHGDLIVYGRYNAELECYTKTVVAYAAGTWTKFVTLDDPPSTSKEKCGGIDEAGALHDAGTGDSGHI